MAGSDLRLDETGDYIEDGEGFFESNQTAGSAVRHQVMTELNTWVGDLEAGRVQHGINARNASEAEAELERESLRRGMRELEIAGLIDSTEIKVTKTLPTRFSVSLRTRDTQSGGTIQIGEIEDFGV